MDMTPAFADALAEPRGLDADRFGLKIKGFKRGAENFFSSEIGELMSVYDRCCGRRRGVAEVSL
jgi:hypothetical protein